MLTTRTGIKVSNPFLFRFRRWEILKGQILLKAGIRNLKLAYAQTIKF